MKLKKRSFTLYGHRTSIALENEFWDALESIANQRSCSLSQVVSQIDNRRGQAPLASSLRIAVLNHFRNSALTN